VPRGAGGVVGLHLSRDPYEGSSSVLRLVGSSVSFLTSRVCYRLVIVWGYMLLRARIYPSFLRPGLCHHLEPDAA